MCVCEMLIETLRLCSTGKDASKMKTKNFTGLLHDQECQRMRSQRKVKYELDDAIDIEIEERREGHRRQLPVVMCIGHREMTCLHSGGTNIVDFHSGFDLRRSKHREDESVLPRLN